MRPIFYDVVFVLLYEVKELGNFTQISTKNTSQLLFYVFFSDKNVKTTISRHDGSYSYDGIAKSHEREPLLGLYQ